MEMLKIIQFKEMLHAWSMSMVLTQTKIPYKSKFALVPLETLLSQSGERITLDNDKTYTLTETKNPNEGYNMLGEPVTLTLHEDKASVFDDATLETWQDVENYKGTILPSTGGIGTVIFYVLGSLLVIGCGIVLISRRRMQDK